MGLSWIILMIWKTPYFSKYIHELFSFKHNYIISNRNELYLIMT